LHQSHIPSAHADAGSSSHCVRHRVAFSFGRYDIGRVITG
jgi:hypothetical protein